MSTLSEYYFNVTRFSKSAVCQVQDEPLPVLRGGRLDVCAVLSLSELWIASIEAKEGRVLQFEAGRAVFVRVPSRVWQKINICFEFLEQNNNGC